MSHLCTCSVASNGSFPASKRSSVPLLPIHPKAGTSRVSSFGRDAPLALDSRSSTLGSGHREYSINGSGGRG